MEAETHSAVITESHLRSTRIRLIKSHSGKKPRPYHSQSMGDTAHCSEPLSQEACPWKFSPPVKRTG